MRGISQGHDGSFSRSYTHQTAQVVGRRYRYERQAADSGPGQAAGAEETRLSLVVASLDSIGT